MLRSNDGAPLLEVFEVSKSFAGVEVLRDVSFALRPAVVTALIGENGAGKSTLVKILTGIFPPNRGEIRIDGRAVYFNSPRDAWSAGVAAIHQETIMFEELSVAENIYMGHMPTVGAGLVDRREMRQKTAILLEQLGADFAAQTPLKQLRVAQRHLVEIARALSHDSRVVIMDEPTSALSKHEVDDLFRVIARLKRQGCAVLFISHKFDEILEVADQWVCLRDGEQVGAGAITETSVGELVKLMVGRSIDQVFPIRHSEIGAPMLEVIGISDRSQFADVSFTLRKGEILGLYGLVGSGRSEAMQALFGLSPKSGEVKLRGEPIEIRSPADAIAAGVAYVPEDRQREGAILPLGITENVTLASLDAHSRAGFMLPKRELGTTRSLGRRFSIKASHWKQPIRELSGGNQQKVLIARWLATQPDILILDEPTKGIDVGSKTAIYAFMTDLVAAGLSIILISSELPEVIGMSDTILVMHEGRIIHRFARADATPEAIVTAASGGEGGRPH